MPGLNKPTSANGLLTVRALRMRSGVRVSPAADIGLRAVGLLIEERVALQKLARRGLTAVEPTLTDRYQTTTMPETVRRALKPGKRDKILYTIRPSGEVSLTRAFYWACCGSSATRCRPTGWRSGRWWRGLMPDQVTSPRSPAPRHCGIQRTCPPAASRHP